MGTAASSRRVFLSLALLAGLTLAGLLAILAWQMPVLAQGVWLACQDAVAAVHGSVRGLGMALPFLLLVAGVVRGGWSIAAQVWHTRRLVSDLEHHSVESPISLLALASELHLSGRLRLVADERPYTFTEGLWFPRIWISTGMLALLDGEELRAVLRHERHHLRQRDPLRVLLSRSLARALFFVPLAQDLRDAYLVAKEVDADMASESDAALATALLKLVRVGPSLPAQASLAAIGPMDATSARIQRLLYPEHGGRWRVRARQVGVSLALGLALVAFTYASMVWAASPLDGGQCGYGAWVQPQDTASAENWPAAPVDYTPASLSIEP